MAEKSVDNHFLSLLLPALREHADKPLFRPYLGNLDEWGTVTYVDFERRLTVAQEHWRNKLAPLQLKPLDIIGFWLTGRKITDIVNTLAVSSLGYIPQFFSGYFSGLAVIVELLVKTGGKAIALDPSYKSQIAQLNSLPVPSLITLEDWEIQQTISEARGPLGPFQLDPNAAVRLDDYAALFHTSGTSGGTPKVIPNTHKMLRAVILYKHSGAQGIDDEFLANGGAQTVANTVGNHAHIATYHTFLGAVHTGTCMVQTSSMAATAEEFLALVRVCGLTRLILFATFLANIIRAARTDPAIRDALKDLRQIFHTGVALNKEDEQWAYDNGLRIITSYSTTETAPLLRSRIGTDAASRLLRPVRGANPAFLPYKDTDGGSSPGLELYEIVVPAGADDCPPPALVAPDGYYHTGDIFQKIEDGWVYRGRAGDWIKVLDGFVDTKTIEDAVRKAGAGLVYDAVVVGNGRAAAVLLVESAEAGVAMDAEKRRALAQTLVERMADFNRHLFPHERVADPRRVVVLERGTLLRGKEKGNVRCVVRLLACDPSARHARRWWRADH
ncbi:acetyl-CoA synthetase-like protein [Trametes elegans]|nr:acetyl-CoA synthetase-like protein [Trametes elegans]